MRVHPEWLERQHLPPGPRGRAFWEQRYRVDQRLRAPRSTATARRSSSSSSTSPRQEQRKRLLARLDDPEKEWKFSAADLAERAHWDEYMAGLRGGDHAPPRPPWAPWYVIPADRKPLMRALAAG